MQLAFWLKFASIAFAVFGGSTALWAPWLPRTPGDDPDKVRRRFYLTSYSLTTISMLLLAITAFF